MNSSTTEEALQIIQNVNTFVATALSFLVHGYIIRRLLRKYSLLTLYQNLLVAQSSVYIIGTILRFCVNRAVTLKMDESVGYSFIHVANWVKTVFEFSVSIVEDAEGLMLIIFNGHRLLIFLRPRFIKGFYLVTIPSSLIFIACDAYIDIFNPDFRPNLSDVFFVAICAITIGCYVILRRHVRRNTYSDAVKRMQNKLSSSLLMEIFVHLVALALTDIVGPIIILVQNAFGINGRAFTVIGVIYIMVVYMLFMWYPVAIGAIVRWSISGFLSRSDSESSRVKGTPATRTSTLQQQNARNISTF